MMWDSIPRRLACLLVAKALLILLAVAAIVAAIKLI
jgi:hypothetical protein